ETGPSRAVLDALARALRLDEDERIHLYALADHAARRTVRRSPPSRTVGAGVRQLMATVRPCPAYVLNRTSDVLAANPEGLALLAGIETWPVHRRNIVRYVFRHPAARSLFAQWDQVARDCVAHLRTVAAADPESTELADLVGE